MRVLKLNNVTQLTDVLNNLIKKCPLLEILELNNLDKLSDLFL